MHLLAVKHLGTLLLLDEVPLACRGNQQRSSNRVHPATVRCSIHCLMIYPAAIQDGGSSSKQTTAELRRVHNEQQTALQVGIRLTSHCRLGSMPAGECTYTHRRKGMRPWSPLHRAAGIYIMQLKA